MPDGVAGRQVNTADEPVSADRDNLREQNTRLTALLTDQRPKPAAAETEQPKKGFFKKLFGG